MDRDDAPIGRVLTRREALGVLGVSTLGLLGGRSLWSPGTPGRSGSTADPGCVVRPEQMEGPYFVDERLNRSDIRSDPVTGAVKEGTPLALVLAVASLRDGACTPLAGAHVDVWHCDATGVYSDVKDPGFDTRGQRFLRGYQITDSKGEARFQTIYPGWYEGRAVHIHFKIRTDPGAGRGTEFVSQLYFDDALNSRVLGRMPYAGKRNGPSRNAADEIFADGGKQLILAPNETGRGYAARFVVGLETV
jgi:protocatechuate 3,4-dioxygenase beta subunit